MMTREEKLLWEIFGDPNELGNLDELDEMMAADGFVWDEEHGGYILP